MRPTLLFTISLFACITAQAVEGRSKAKELAAIHTQEQSIQKLRAFLKNHPNDPREPDFLIRLSDLYFEKSGISFQYTEGESVKTGNKYYTESLTQGSSILSEMLRKYPSHVSAPDAFFKRGKAYKELKKIELSKADYLKLMAVAPNYYRLDAALMDLADYAQDANRHDEALKYLLQIEKNEKSQYFTMALHKAAWSYFNLANFPSAIQYLKKEILTYQSRTGETPYLESAYQDLALFYFESINKKSGYATVSDAVETFEELSKGQVDTQKRPFFGLLLTRFSKLLKAYMLSNELAQLKGILLKKYDEMPETMEIAMLIYEYHFDRHEYAKLIPLLTDADSVRTKVNKAEFNTKFEKAISNSLAQLHQYIAKNKQSTELDQLLKPATELTDFLQAHLSTQNPTTVLALYSMAETAFSINRYSMATKYYTELLKPEVILPSQLNRSTLLIRVVSSRFQELKSMNLIKDKLAIVKLDAPLVEIKKNEKQAIQEWLGWVFDPQTVSNIDSFAFQLEAHKLKYQFLDRKEALVGLESFSLQNSSADEARVAAAIVLDTHTESKDWKSIFELSTRLLSKKNWKDAKFVEKIQDMASDAHLKITIASTNPDEILSRTKDCIKQFKHAKIVLQCKLIQAKTWVSLKQYSESEHALAELSKASLKDDDLKAVILMKAEVHQKQGKLGLATQEMEHYLEMTGYQDAEMTQQVVQMHWFQRNFAKIRPLIRNTKVCEKMKNNYCEQYEAALAVLSPYQANNYLKYFKLSTKAPKTSASLWAMAALEQSDKRAFQDRLVLLQRLANNWENLDGFLQIQLLETMTSRVNAAIQQAHKLSRGIAPLTSVNEAAIEKRMALLQDLDRTFAKVMKLNWLEVKIHTASELNLVYQELVADLKAIGTPDNLVQPFVKKTNEIADANQQLLAMAFRVRTSPISLLDNEVKDKIPSTYWEEWTNAVKQQKPDYLYYLISIRTQDEFSPLLRGLVLTTLLKNAASTEGFEMIKSAPQSQWKESIALRVAQ